MYYLHLVNVARFYKISPEEAMLHANEKFARRFGYVEQQVKESGKDICCIHIRGIR